MITLHHLNNSRSQRILWMLEELEIPYQVKRYERDKVTGLAPPELKEIHPLGKSPVITDDDITIAESGAIIEYLADTYGAGRLLPARESADYRQCQYWLHHAEGSLMPFLVMKLVFDRIESSPMPFFIKPVARMIVNKALDSYVGPNIKAQMDYVEQYLATHRWFAGDLLSAADIQMSFPLEASASRGAMANSHQHIKEWVARIHARPAYQRALEKGGAYDYA